MCIIVKESVVSNGNPPFRGQKKNGQILEYFKTEGFYGCHFIKAQPDNKFWDFSPFLLSLFPV